MNLIDLNHINFICNNAPKVALQQLEYSVIVPEGIFLFPSILTSHKKVEALITISILLPSMHQLYKLNYVEHLLIVT